MMHKAAAWMLFIIALSILLSLGAWQWRRGVDKTAAQTTMQTAMDSPYHIPISSVAALRAHPLAYQQAQLEGEWQNADTVFLANRVHRGRVGYEAFTPFRLMDGALMLVNRGWVADTAAPPAALAPRGRIYAPQTGFTLGDAYRPPAHGATTNALVLQYLETGAVAELLDEAVQPIALALHAAHADALTSIWTPMTIPPARHFGYAVQWWGLALTLLVFGVVWHRRGNRRSRSRIDYR